MWRRRLQLDPQIFRGLIAISAAMVTHLWLFYYGISTDNLLSPKSSLPELSVSLMPAAPTQLLEKRASEDQQAENESVQQARYVVKQAAVEQEEESTVMAEAQRATEPSATHVELSAATLRSWANRELKSSLQPTERSLAEFAESFTATKPAPAQQFVAQQNVYGESHIRTRIGDRDVCYMDSNLFVKDEFNAGLVMFYDCGEAKTGSFSLKSQ